jgi:hypothetical protein
MVCLQDQYCTQELYENENSICKHIQTYTVGNYTTFNNIADEISLFWEIL